MNTAAVGELRTQYGPWALIAGASEGIGEAFARQLAGQGINLVLLSRSQKKLDRLQQSLVVDYRVETKTIAVDLTADDLLEQVVSATEGIDVGLLIYNAGAVHGAGYFLDDALDKALGLVALNCRGPVLLAHHFGAAMRERKRGGMIFLSSMAAYAGGAYIATYAATKSFDIIFAQSLWHEMAQYNVQVLGLVAGATKTPAMAASGIDFDAAEQAGNFAAMDPAEVAAEGLAQLAHGPIWIVGDNNRGNAELFSSLSRADAVEAMSSASAKMYGKPHVSVAASD